MDFRDLSADELPHTSKIVRDYLGNFSRLKSFYEHPPDFKSVTKYARKLEFPADRRRQVADVLRAQNVLFGSSPETGKNIDRLAEGAVAVVSGQQVGLFGGPAYSFYKALTAIQAAESLTSNGISAVPIFWMATEDHDVEEVRHVTWFHEGQLLRFELPKPEQEAIPVGRVRFGPEIDEVVRRAQPLLGETFGNYLHETYIPEATYGSAFAGLFARIFADFGLILLDPLDDRLHQIAAPVFRDALACRNELSDELLRRGKALEQAGYDPQVKVTPRSTLLFSLASGKREVITASNGTFASGNLSLPREEWLELVKAEPEKFSPNAILRPVVQDFLLPTVAYFGGPSEIAYFAQSQVLYEKLLKRMPVLLPRADFTLVDPKGERLLKKYHLNVEDVWAGSESLRKSMYNSVVPKKLSGEFDDSLLEIDKRLKKLHKAIAKVDPTIQGTIARAEKRIRYQIEKLRHKTGAALDRHEKQIEQHLKFLENLLFPRKDLQSRDLCFLPFLARWGSGGLYELQKLTAPKRLGRHMIVPIP